jgi:hypothetical protein
MLIEDLDDEADDFEAELRAAQAQADEKKRQVKAINAFDGLDAQEDDFADEHRQPVYDPLGLGNNQNDDENEGVDPVAKKKKKRKKGKKADTAIMDHPPDLLNGDGFGDLNGLDQQGKLKIG